MSEYDLHNDLLYYLSTDSTFFEKLLMPKHCVS